MAVAAALPAIVLTNDRTTHLGGAILLVAYGALVVAFYLSGDR
jgi:Ca2+/H+ antiporter